MPRPSAILGIDPGLSGGLAVVGQGVVECHKMPATEKDIFDEMWTILNNNKIERAYIEKVHAMPKQGVTSSFTFGQNYGLLRGFLVSLEIPFETVAPGVWQRALGCLSKGDKRITKAKAQELFPTVKVTHYVADALLIAEYGWRLNEHLAYFRGDT